jgi:CDGSH-type Zn-finger protein
LSSGPIVREEEPGRKAWCSCGLSKRQPMCDGSHRSVGKAPVIVELTEKKTCAWCTCKQTKTPPYCDGTHKTLPA